MKHLWNYLKKLSLKGNFVGNSHIFCKTRSLPAILHLQLQRYPLNNLPLNARCTISALIETNSYLVLLSEFHIMPGLGTYHISRRITEKVPSFAVAIAPRNYPLICTQTRNTYLMWLHKWYGLTHKYNQLFSLHYLSY